MFHLKPTPLSLEVTVKYNTEGGEKNHEQIYTSDQIVLVEENFWSLSFKNSPHCKSISPFKVLLYRYEKDFEKS